jgi:SAM-dependent methyltransferase
MSRVPDNRFEDFFQQPDYLALKNHLYNYRLRKRAVEGACQPGEGEWVLEVGSGISPVMTGTERVIYSDLSLAALQVLRRELGRGQFVVADGARLPFKNGSVAHAVCSEVLEHVADDRRAMGELARVLKPAGDLVITFPHGKFYFANDDRFVGHYRRYDLPEMEQALAEAGLQPILVRKVLGPLEKLTMCVTIFVLEQGKKFSSGISRSRASLPVRLLAPFFKAANRLYAALVWLDARLMPQRLAAVLLIRAEKREGEKLPISPVSALPESPGPATSQVK